jgi:endonuclease/exonuclease/phosphatase (EEP) superfamily protein YafD
MYEVCGGGAKAERCVRRFWRDLFVKAAPPLRLAAGGAAGVCAACALALFAAPFSDRFDVLRHFTPLFFLASLAALGAVYALGQRRAVLALAAFACLGPALIMAPEFAAATAQALTPRPPAEAPQLKLMSMNLWLRNYELDAAEALIRREQPDILILEEADDQWRTLIERIADEYGHMAYCMREYWCNTIILSRFDFVEDITPPVYAIAAARMALPERLGGGVIEVVGVHAHWPWPAGRQQQEFAQIGAFSKRLNPERALIAGDFNSTPWSNTLGLLDAEVPFPRRTRALFSWPAPARAFFGKIRAPIPMMPIDQIYAGTNWRVVELRRGPAIGSDHYPLIAVFTPKSMPAPALRGFSPAGAAARP